MQSDKVTDLFYGMSFLAGTGLLWASTTPSLSHHVLLGMIALWSIRLALYLFRRVHVMGHDARFNQLRKRFIAIAGFWLLQTISIIILSLPIIFFFQSPSISFGGFQWLGLALWLMGWLVESIADQQKFSFRINPANEGHFINSGLWKWVQHPNYLGEILCWIGIFIFVIPALKGWEWIAIISPIWIATLLLFISGIPLLQRASKKKYGHLEKYQTYRKNTALLIPYIY